MKFIKLDDNSKFEIKYILGFFILSFVVSKLEGISYEIALGQVGLIYLFGSFIYILDLRNKIDGYYQDKIEELKWENEKLRKAHEKNE